MKATAAPILMPYAENTDPADMVALSQAIAERVHVLLNDFDPALLKTAGAGDAGKLLVVQNTGDAVWKALSGNATLSEGGVITIGSKQISTGMLADLCVTAAKIALEAVGSSQIAALAIIAEKLGAECVQTGKIQNLAVTAAKMANETITPGKLATETKRLFPQLVEGLRAKDRMSNFSQEFVNEGVKEWEAAHGLPGVANQQNLQVYYGVFNNNAVPSAKDIVTVKAVTATKITFRREGAELKTILFWWKAEVW